MPEKLAGLDKFSPYAGLMQRRILTTPYCRAVGITAISGVSWVQFGVESSWNVMAHGDAGRGSEGETGEWGA
jgi:hypothetical protein